MNLFITVLFPPDQRRQAECGGAFREGTQKALHHALNGIGDTVVLTAGKNVKIQTVEQTYKKYVEHFGSFQVR